MEEMTNEQFKTILEMIIQIIKDNNKEDAIKKNRSLTEQVKLLTTQIKDMAVLAAAISMI